MKYLLLLILLSSCHTPKVWVKPDSCEQVGKNRFKYTVLTKVTKPVKFITQSGKEMILGVKAIEYTDTSYYFIKTRGLGKGHCVDSIKVDIRKIKK